LICEGGHHGRAAEREVTIDLKHGVEAKNYAEVSMDVAYLKHVFYHVHTTSWQKLKS
jgi:uncharacterized protein (UPF0248 family)